MFQYGPLFGLVRIHPRLLSTKLRWTLHTDPFLYSAPVPQLNLLRLDDRLRNQLETDVRFIGFLKLGRVVFDYAPIPRCSRTRLGRKLVALVCGLGGRLRMTYKVELG